MAAADPEGHPVPPYVSAGNKKREMIYGYESGDGDLQLIVTFFGTLLIAGSSLRQDAATVDAMRPRKESTLGKCISLESDDGPILNHRRDHL